MGKKMPPAHPGEILYDLFMEPLGLSNYALAKAINVAPIRISEIVRGKRAITPDTALRLARYFGNTPEIWLGLQKRYELDLARDKVGKKIEREIKPRPRETVDVS